jgi:spore coat polysaccharide biosynthesis protein SpsF (cytidylyltransferase family)
MNRTRPRVVGIIQARTNSSRLPGKVLQDIAGRPMIARVIERARRARALEELWLAKTTDAGDDAVAAVAAAEGIPVHRGSLQDVLARYIGAAEASGADVVVRLTGDNPLLEPAYVDAAVDGYFESGADIAVARDPADVVPGTGCEVTSLAALRIAAERGHSQEDREHVTWYLLANRDRFTVTALAVPPAMKNPGIRLAVDEAADLALVRDIYDRLGAAGEFTLSHILDLRRREPALFERNTTVRPTPHLWGNQRAAQNARAGAE